MKLGIVIYTPEAETVMKDLYEIVRDGDRVITF